MGVRAEQHALTRRRIAEAAVELHGTVGPARTTISAIAERAGVERLTVYRHFPDEHALYAACSSHFLREHPPPDLEARMSIADPMTRTQAVLLTLYRYYRETQGVLNALLRDAAAVPLVAEYLGPYRTMLAELADSLSAAMSDARDARVRRAVIGHAVSFTTWRSLAVDEGLDDEEAAALMAHLASTAGRVRTDAGAHTPDGSAKRSNRRRAGRR